MDTNGCERCGCSRTEHSVRVGGEATGCSTHLNCNEFRKNQLADFEETMNVEFLPHTDFFMLGLRHGTVAAVGRKYVKVMVFSLTDARFRYVKVLPRDLLIKD